jgi:hypothetical protein
MRFIAIAIVSSALLLMGCVPSDVPSMAPDGNQIVCVQSAEPAVQQDGKRAKPEHTLVLVNLTSASATPIQVDAKWEVMGAAWIGDRLVVGASEPLAQPTSGGPSRRAVIFFYDTATKALSPTGMSWDIESLPTLGSFKGKPAWFTIDDKRKATLIFSADGQQELGSLPGRREPAGGNWRTRILSKEKSEPLTTDLIGVEISDGDGVVACMVPESEIAKACTRQARQPELCVMSPDGARVVMAFNTETIFRQAETEYTFGMFDVANGKLLFAGGSNALRGVPLIDRESIIVVEAEDRNRKPVEFTSAPPRLQPSSKPVLVRHTKAGREILSRIPIDEATDSVSCYAFTPDRAQCILQVAGPNPRLVIMPVAKDVALGQCRQIPLLRDLGK